MNFRGSGRGGGGGGGPDPLSPSGSAHGMHLKKGTWLKCSVIIGRKVGLDYNSWYACLPLIRHVGRSSFANFDSRWERERERGCTVFAHESFVLAWFLRISKHSVWVSQSILLQLLPMRTQNPNLSCASAFVRQSRTFHSINALCAHIFKLTKHSILNTIRVWSWSKPCLQIERERERERLVQARQGKHCIGGSTSRERCVCVCVCVCVLFNFVSLFFLLWELV